MAEAAIMRLTDFERGLRSPLDVLAEHLQRKKDRAKRARTRAKAIPPAERRARRQLALAACYRLGEHQKVALLLGLHATSVTRWVNGRSVVPARHLPALRAIVDHDWSWLL